MKIKMLFIVMLLLCSTLVSAQTTEDVDAGVTPDSKYRWMLERGFEKLSETIGTAQSKERAKARHALERVAEARVMIQENKAEHAQRAIEKVPESNTEIREEYNDKFEITQEVLDGVVAKINTQLDSERARKHLMSNANILFVLKTPGNNLNYYKVTLDDWQIIGVTQTIDDVGDYTHQITMSHGEFYALQKVSTASMIGHLRNVRLL